MRTHDELTAYSPALGPPTVAVGNFDGVHLGHQEIFHRVIAEARRRTGDAVVLTFSPHPAQVLAPDRAPPLIQSEAAKLARLAECGLDAAVVVRFDADFAARSPEEFVKTVLVDGLNAVEAFVGYDFTFGRNRSGTTATLAALGARHGFSTQVVEPITVEGIVASSTKVREFVLEGRPEGAALLLGRPYSLTGTVVRGAGRGRTIGVPTANIEPCAELVPRRGVYAARLHAPAGSHDAVVNVGTAPTFGQRDTVVEAHLLDFDGDLLGACVELEVVRRLRDERRFPDKDALVSQIHADIAQAREVLAG